MVQCKTMSRNVCDYALLPVRFYWHSWTHSNETSDWCDIIICSQRLLKLTELLCRQGIWQGYYVLSCLRVLRSLFDSPLQITVFYWDLLTSGCWFGLRILPIPTNLPHTTNHFSDFWFHLKSQLWRQEATQDRLLVLFFSLNPQT